MPDGQGQTGSFSLLSAQRVEILRGPFSALYGNASGGVISVFIEDPPESPLLTFSGGGGSYGTGTFGVKLGTRSGRAGAVIAASEFVTDGYRDHSSARRDRPMQARARRDTGHPPDADRQYAVPAGNGRSARPHARAMGRESTRCRPGGDPVRHPGRQSIRCRRVRRSTIAFGTTWSCVDAYGGRRLVRQYLAFSGAALTSSGGVVDLDRDYGGVGARLVWRGGAWGARWW